MCDFYKEADKKSNVIKNSKSRNHSKTNGLVEIINEFNDSRFVKPDTSQSGSQSPSSFTNPTSPSVKSSSFLQNINLKTIPSAESFHLKINQINIKTQRFIKVTNDFKNKIELLEEIYSGPEYKQIKVVNKLIQCSISVDTPHQILNNLISKLNSDNESCFGRSIHPAYSNESTEDNSFSMDDSGTFKIPASYQNESSVLSASQPEADHDNGDYLVDLQSSVDYDASTQSESFFLEHEGNCYVRVDDTNYHLIQTVSRDRIITTETGLQLIIPDGIKIPDALLGNFADGEENGIAAENENGFYNEDDVDYGDERQFLSAFNDVGSRYRHDLDIESSVQLSSRKSYKDNAFLTHYTYQTSNPAKPFSDYVGLPPRPVPQMPFTLSSQLYTPELSISLTDRDCELMLTIDCSKKGLPQQQSLYYQIYSYRDEDRYTKPTSEVWGLVGEIRACPLPMFCTISIPSGVHKHYFSIRSVDEFNRFSDWSNVVQVEVESNQNSSSSNGR